MELEIRVLFAQLLPKPPDAEIVAMNIDIVQQSNAPTENFGIQL